MMHYFDALSWSFSNTLEGDTQALFAVVFFLVGFAVCGSFLYQLRIRAWPSVPGTLRGSAVARWGATEMVTHEQDYSVEVCYDYEVDGERHTGQRFSPWVVVASHNLKWILEKRLRVATAQDTLEVFYNPRNPTKSFLVRPGIVGLLVTASLAVFCFWCPVLVWQAV